MNDKPIYIQLMQMIEDNILLGNYKENDLVISSTQICKLYNVNHVTAMRSLTQLVNDDVLVKDRGIGMRVTKDAKNIISKKRKNHFNDFIIKELLSEANKLRISKEELIKSIEEKFNEESKEKSV